MRIIDIANAKATKPKSIFRGRDYLGTPKSSPLYKHQDPNAVNLSPKYKYNYTKRQLAYIKANGGLKTNPTNY